MVEGSVVSSDTGLTVGSIAGSKIGTVVGANVCSSVGGPNDGRRVGVGAGVGAGAQDVVVGFGVKHSGGRACFFFFLDFLHGFFLLPFRSTTGLSTTMAASICN